VEDDERRHELAKHHRRCLEIASVGAITVAPSDPNVIYVGSGEADLREDWTYGDGMYRSTDAGETWTHLGLDDARHIARIVVDPRNPDRVFVAALGMQAGRNAMRGVYRSSDGGKSWQRVLYSDDSTGAIDIAMDPGNSRIAYAALWHMQRTPWGFTAGNGSLWKDDGRRRYLARYLTQRRHPEEPARTPSVSRCRRPNPQRVYATESNVRRKISTGESSAPTTAARVAAPSGDQPLDGASVVLQWSSPRIRRTRNTVFMLTSFDVEGRRWRTHILAQSVCRTATPTRCGSIQPTRAG
jgi:hypothetical protein